MDKGRTIEAPVYRPFGSYRPPTAVSFQPRTDTLSVAELRDSPAAWAIVLRHAPQFATIIDSPDAKPYLSTMTLENFIVFGDITAATIAAIDVDLVRLPRDPRPAP